MDMQYMPTEFLDGMKVIMQAETHGRSQLILLDNKIRELKCRIRRCSQTGNKAYQCSLERRQMIAQNVRAVYQHYVMKKKADAVRLFIEAFRKETLPLVGNRIIIQEVSPVVETEGE
jgi:hypothetical protein